MVQVTPDIQARLLGAREAYVRDVSPHYDETLETVVASVAASGSVGKADIGALLFWKRLRADTTWAKALHAWPDDQVREATAPAVKIARDTDLDVAEAARASRSALAVLPGFVSGDALASAVLLAAAPTRMAVFDRRAETGLRRLGIALDRRPGRYGRYMALLDDMRIAVSADRGAVTCREIDTALYWLGG